MESSLWGFPQGREISLSALLPLGPWPKIQIVVPVFGTRKRGHSRERSPRIFRRRRDDIKWKICKFLRINCAISTKERKGRSRKGGSLDNRHHCPIGGRGGVVLKPEEEENPEGKSDAD